MILRAVTLSLGLAGAFGAAQFPAYSHQYMQRLGGAVDALAQVVADFDTSAASLGLSREAALAQMTGTAFVERRRADMERTFARHEMLARDLAALDGMGPFMRAYHAPHLTDAEIARGTWAAFRPALPLDLAAALFGLIGFGVTRLILRTCLSLPGVRRPSAPVNA